MPQLTGIQRVVASVLEQLLRTGTDVRLFRFSHATQSLIHFPPDELPPVVLAGGRSSTPKSGSQPNWDPAVGDKDFLAVAYRRGPFSVRNAIDYYRFAHEALQHALETWMTSDAGPNALTARRRRQIPSKAASASEQPLFRSGDACLSICLTANLPGYWDAIAANKPKDVPFLQLLHDIEQVMEPQWTPPHWIGFDAWLQDVIAHSARLLTTSRFQESEIHRYLRSRQQSLPVDVIPLGDNPTSLGFDAPPTARIEACGARPYVLCVSGFFLRKNHYALYQVWRRLAATLGDACPQLILVGETPKMYVPTVAQMERDPLTKDRISIFFDVGDAELVHLYRGCLFTVYPSFYEGWGLPVAESLGFGRYCIASSAASLPEVGGDLIDYIDPADHMDLFRTVLRAIQDPAYVRARETIIRQSYVPRSWAETTRHLLASVEKARAALPR